MSGHGHAATCVASGEAALRAVDSNPFDVVLCDVMMPVMSGLELYEALRLKHPDLAARLIFVTGGVFTRAISDQLARTGNPLPAKPFRPSDVRKLIAQMLANSGAAASP